ncbi:hypothetical protein COY95_00120, partial [Candidatus Woesearchaeota archaeon CG_4_10_14_0_8_um_filter_47_5]
MSNQKKAQIPGSEKNAGAKKPDSGKAFQPPPGSTQPLMKGSKVSELLNRKNNGTDGEKQQAVLGLIKLVAAKNGDIGKKGAILLSLLENSERLRVLGEAVETMAGLGKPVEKLIDVAI